MRAIHRSNRADVARSLLELEKQFGRKPPDEKQNAQLTRPGELKNTLPAHDSTVLPEAQGGRK